MSAPARPPLVLRGEERLFYDRLRAHELVFQACSAYEAVVFPLRTVCPSCGGEHLELRRSAGRGVLHSLTEQHRPAHPSFADRVPYTVALADMAEGFRVLASVADPAGLAVGTPVQVVFEAVEEDLVLLGLARVERPGEDAGDAADEGEEDR